MSNGFISRHKLWSEAQKEAAERLLQQIEKQGIEIVRLSWSDQHGLARQHGQVVFEPVEMELRALLQPLRIGGALALVFFSLKVLQVEHQRHHRAGQQQQQPQQPQQGEPVAAGVLGRGLLQQRKVQRLAGRRGGGRGGGGGHGLYRVTPG